MIEIQRKLIEYINVSTGKRVTHHILIAIKGKQSIMLSHPNIYICNEASYSKDTSSRYSSIISKFYKYLSSLEKFENTCISKYHVISDNNDIKKWQISRQVQRVKTQVAKPSSGTIFEEAKLVLGYFKWLSDSGYPTNVIVKTKTWKVNFKSKRLLEHIDNKAKTKIDSKNITVLDKESRQKRSNGLITKNEIYWLKESFVDPVYGSMLMLSLGTAMRPIDLCKFPYIGNGENLHIMPYAEMDKDTNVFDYLVKNSKGGKSRVIKINKNDLERLDSEYIKPYYTERKILYEKKYGRKCPPNILFLNKLGKPVTKTMLASRANDAKNRALQKHPEFRESVTFYDSRSWWPTLFLIRFFQDEILNASADAIDLAVGEAIKNQMGHTDLSTTYMHYVDMARLFIMAHSGRVHDLINESYDAVSFLEKHGTILD